MRVVDGAGIVDGRAPLPPPALRDRVGGIERYEEIGSLIRGDLVELLPPGWSFEGKRVLDFGCGAGRVLRHFLGEAQTAEFHGCDIDAESIEWLTAHLCPPLQAFQNGEAPPLPQPDSYFGLIWAASVFTHITDHWSAWLLELHRVLKDGGLLIATFLGPGCISLIQEEWEADRIGMNVVGYGQSWDQRGPTVFLSPWWIAEHWGRAFEILDLREAGFGNPGNRNGMQGVVLLRKRPERPTQEELERINPEEPREVAAVRHNIRQLHAESQILHDGWQSSLQGLESQDRQYRAEVEALRSALRAVQTSRSWRMTSPLRQAGELARRLRSRARSTLP